MSNVISYFKNLYFWQRRSVCHAFLTSIFAVLALSLGGCASSDTAYRHGIEPDYSEQSQAPGWAYAADSFTFSKTMPVGKKNDFEFYYKRCELGGERPYYSKTSYECTEAPR